MKTGAAMEAILNSFYRTGTPRTAGHFARSIKAGLRRAFELAGAPYADGQSAPM
jgi:hypothetical protein